MAYQEISDDWQETFRCTDSKSNIFKEKISSPLLIISIDTGKDAYPIMIGRKEKRRLTVVSSISLIDMHY